MEGKLHAIYILPALQGHSVIASDFRNKISKFFWDCVTGEKTLPKV